MILRDVGRAIADTLFPRTCPLCDGLLTVDEDVWCSACALELGELVAAFHCPTCGARTGPYTTPDQRCLRCRGQKWTVTWLVRVGPYEEPLRRLILGYKFRGRHRVDRVLARMLADALRGRGGVEAIDAFVPIPTRSRDPYGWAHHPVAQVAREVSRMLDRPSLPILRKRFGVRPQVGLTPPQRRENIRGAFRLRIGARPAGATLCLIDDVATTGATLDEAGRVLRAAGAREVVAAVIAKADSQLEPR